MKLDITLLAIFAIAIANANKLSSKKNRPSNGERMVSRDPQEELFLVVDPEWTTSSTGSTITDQIRSLRAKRYAKQAVIERKSRRPTGQSHHYSGKSHPYSGKSERLRKKRR
ncbi:hypothetical protein PSACC_00222 [Paramicrosporidium saccamoebae]|uniref:Secreted protein n=1 Tax=Paramicrosporidium saccamoebae TaxID=1246581 RepID=A0A2H9TQD5_9FUNG|nr:hypothetical protein PSACC_00706 [Paramicrosporidium saccamoebae]PJF19963.1 hypothetical protein PSACC_00222 [Paramicrosporidium saccamoebae]